MTLLVIPIALSRFLSILRVTKMIKCNWSSRFQKPFPEVERVRLEKLMYRKFQTFTPAANQNRGKENYLVLIVNQHFPVSLPLNKILRKVLFCIEQKTFVCGLKVVLLSCWTMHFCRQHQAEMKASTFKSIHDFFPFQNSFLSF